jgi:hypothetical protein
MCRYTFDNCGSFACLLASAPNAMHSLLAVDGIAILLAANGLAIRLAGDAEYTMKGEVLMKMFNIILKSINDVKDFVNIANKYDFDIDMTSGRYVVDAKSIMGIFSLDLSKSIKVEAHGDDELKFYNDVKRFEV